MTLSEARDLVGLTQHQLAKLAGLQQSDISSLENGRNRRPSWVVVSSITRALRESGLKNLMPEQIFPVQSNGDERLVS